MNGICKVYLLVLLALGIGCSSNKNKNTFSESSKTSWSEEQKRKYFQDSIAYRQYNGRHSGDTINDFESFIERYYPNFKAWNKHNPMLYACEEPWIDTSNIDTNKCWFRINVSPCFAKPYCLIIEKKFDRTYLTGKMLSGDGGYYSGLMTFSFTKLFDTILYNQVSRQLNELNFWTINNDTVCKGGLDGDVWYFEAIEKGKFNAITRWGPTHCGNATTLQLGKLGLMLRDSSRLFEVLKVAMNKPYNKFANHDE